MPIGEGNKKKWEKNYLGIEKVFEICESQGWNYEKIQFRGNGPSENYKIKGAKGSFGLIHPIACQFCKLCNRLRITADGCLKTCLYGPEEGSIREQIFDFPAFEKKINEYLDEKPENHQMALNNKRSTWRHMSQIGG
jgi:cyclic pyranopterin phosphate synthase